MPLCDSSEAYPRAVRLLPSPAGLLPGLTAGASEVSRFSCMKFLGVLWGLRLRQTEQGLALARIIRDFEDKRSLLCYKHGDYSVFGARPEASSCLTIAQHSVCCSLIFSASLSLPLLINEKVVPMVALCC